MKSISTVICGVLLGVFAAIAAGPGAARGADPAWALLDENAESYFYYDKSGAAKPRAGTVRVTARVVYTDAGKAETLNLLKPAKGYENLYESRFLYDLDCKGRKSRLLHVSHLDRAGTRLKEFDLSKSTEWEDIPPAARLELVAESECGE